MHNVPSELLTAGIFRSSVWQCTCAARLLDLGTKHEYARHWSTRMSYFPVRCTHGLCVLCRANSVGFGGFIFSGSWKRKLKSPRTHSKTWKRSLSPHTPRNTSGCARIPSRSTSGCARILSRTFTSGAVKCDLGFVSVSFCMLPLVAANSPLYVAVYKLSASLLWVSTVDP